MDQLMKCAAGCDRPATGNVQVTESVLQLGGFVIEKVYRLCDACSRKMEASDATRRAVLDDIQCRGRHV